MTLEQIKKEGIITLGVCRINGGGCNMVVITTIHNVYMLCGNTQYMVMAGKLVEEPIELSEQDECVLSTVDSREGHERATYWESLNMVIPKCKAPHQVKIEED